MKNSNNLNVRNLTDYLKQKKICFSLLSYPEYIKYMALIPIINIDWWLKSINYLTNEVYYVSINSSTTLPHAKASKEKGIRPIMIIDNNDTNLKKSDVFKFGKFNWTVLSSNEQLIAICNDIVDNRCFHCNNFISDYIDCDINKWIDNELIKILLN